MVDSIRCPTYSISPFDFWGYMVEGNSEMASVKGKTRTGNKESVLDSQFG
jgi:hypothetical protein